VRSDDDLLLAVGGGDRRAFATLSGHMVGLVHANIWRALHDKTRTDSVTDEVFVEVWRQAAGFDPSRGPALIWILDLAHRLAAEHDRRGEGGADTGDAGLARRFEVGDRVAQPQRVDMRGGAKDPRQVGRRPSG
jgi:RNA polymerase sigma-70 factor (ECF subfamily)